MPGHLKIIFSRDLASAKLATPLSAALRDRGAIVSGFDKSTGMLAIARRRFGPDADLRVCPDKVKTATGESRRRRR